MKKRLITLITAALLAVGMCVPVGAAEIEKDSADNVFASGDSLSFSQDTFFGAFAAGQTVDLADAEAKGSIAAAGQQVSASGLTVGESLYVGAGTAMLNNVTVKGNLYAAGQNVSITGASSANGVYACGTDVTFEGEANGAVLAGSNVVLNGLIDGDVNIAADKLTIADGTVITGKLTIESAVEPDLSKDIEYGDYEFNLQKEDKEDNVAVSFGTKIFEKFKSCLYWIVAMAAFGMILVWLFDRHLTGAVNYIKNRTLPMILSGVIGWISIPVAAILICFTYILAPTGGLVMSVYVFLIWIGLAFAGASLSRLVFPKMNVYLAALIGIAVLEAVRMIPVIGVIVGIAADMYLIGYFIQYLWLNRMQKKTVVKETAEVQE